MYNILMKPEPDKIVYLLRHGESEGNKENIFQPPDSPLSLKGVKQAEFLAQRLKNLEFEVLLTSNLKRALQTAEVIKRMIGRDYEVVELFQEVKKPSCLFGKKIDDEGVSKVLKEWERTLYSSGLKFQDGESFDELNERAKKALEYLLSRKERRIAIVTHGLFLRVIILKAIFKESFSGEVLKRFWLSTRVDNTGITVLEYYKESLYGKNSWVLRIFNDHAHLGE